MFCTKCGKENEGSSTFCFNCGKDLKTSNKFQPPQMEERAVSSERLTRLQYFYSFILCILVKWIGGYLIMLCLAWGVKLTADSIGLSPDNREGIMALLFFVWMINLFVSVIRIDIRRLHDIGRPGSDWAYVCVPFVLFYWIWFVPGKEAENKYGKRAKTNLKLLLRY